MKDIKFFIAGAKALEQERICLKALANDLSVRYSAKGLHVLAHSYEDFGDKQPLYDDFIENEADIVMLVVDGVMGSLTERELVKAAQAFNRNKRPEVMVFLRGFKKEEITPEIGRIQGLIKGLLGDQFYVDYSSLDDLKVKAQARIMRYLDDCKLDMTNAETEALLSVPPKMEGVVNSVQPEDKVPERPRKNKMWALWILLGIAFATIVAMFFWKQKVLIFAGGGSVANYIKNTTEDSVDVRDYPNSVYINLPSESAWTILSEEANRYMEDSKAGDHGFVSICLSADVIDSTFINEKNRTFFNRARVVGFCIGYDPLNVLIKKGYKNDSLAVDRTDMTISPKELAKQVADIRDNPDKARLFTTSKTSGTLRWYQRCLSKVDTTIVLVDMYNKQQAVLFYKDSSSEYINTLDKPGDVLPYFILGSEQYYPEKLEQSYDKFRVKDEGEILKKPIYIYFIAYKEDEYHCKVRRPIVDFLKEIDAGKKIADNYWKEIKDGRIELKEGKEIIDITKDKD